MDCYFHTVRGFQMYFDSCYLVNFIFIEVDVFNTSAVKQVMGSEGCLLSRRSVTAGTWRWCRCGPTSWSFFLMRSDRWPNFVCWTSVTTGKCTRRPTASCDSRRHARAGNIFSMAVPTLSWIWRVCCHGNMLCRLYCVCVWVEEGSHFYFSSLCVPLSGWRIYRSPSLSWRTWQLCGFLTIRYFLFLFSKKKHQQTHPSNSFLRHFLSAIFVL